MATDRRFALIKDVLRGDEDHTVSAEWTFSGKLDLTFSAVAGQYNSALNIYNGNPQVSIHDTGAAADEGVWNIIGGVDTLKIRSLSDDFATAVDVMSFDRGTGTAVDSVSFYKNVVVDTDGAGPMLSISDGAGADNDSLLQLNTDRPWSFRQHGTGASTALQLFMESSGDKKFYIGSTLTDTAISIGSESGDLTAVGAIQGAELNIAASTGLVPVTGEYGSVQTQGTTGGYGGISFAGNFAWMNSGSAHVGLYNDVNNEWMILAYPNSTVYLYYNGVQEFQTQDSNAAGNSTGAQVKNFNASWYDVGMNVMPRFRSNVSFTLTDQDCGGYMYHSNSTVYTITLNNSSGGGADFPIGGTFFVLNYGTGNITVNTGSGTLYSPQLGTSTTGSRTIGGNSVATILKYGADSWFVWGDAIS